MSGSAVSRSTGGRKLRRPTVNVDLPGAESAGSRRIKPRAPSCRAPEDRSESRPTDTTSA